MHHCTPFFPLCDRGYQLNYAVVVNQIADIVKLSKSYAALLRVINILIREKIILFNSQLIMS